MVAEFKTTRERDAWVDGFMSGHTSAARKFKTCEDPDCTNDDHDTDYLRNLRNPDKGDTVEP